MIHMRQIDCRNCGVSFIGGPRAWYCPECRLERYKKQKAEYQHRKKAGLSRKIGQKLICIDCQAPYYYNFGVGDRCPDCAAKHLKKIDNQQSREWKSKNKDKYLQIKRDYDKNKRASRPATPTGEKYITIDKVKSSNRYRVIVKGKHIGYYSSLEAAVIARDTFLKEGKKNGQKIHTRAGEGNGKVHE